MPKPLRYKVHYIVTDIKANSKNQMTTVITVKIVFHQGGLVNEDCIYDHNRYLYLEYQRSAF